MLDRMLLAAGGEEKLYVEDVFSTYLYTGNSSTQTITNGIDLSGKGGMVWVKGRSISGYDHYVVDSASGSLAYPLATNATRGKTFDFTPYSYVSSLNNNGFSLATGSGDKNDVNGSGTTYASWTFRKAPKFFDVVTYTGDGSSNQTISHNLGIAPGCIIVKRTDSANGWIVYHRGTSVPNNTYLTLQTTNAATNLGADRWSVTSTSFNANGSDLGLNSSGGTYVAYLFAHDTTADGIIQCGSYTGTGAAGNNVTLGWEPQWVMIKPATIGGADYRGWSIFDNMRGVTTNGKDNILLANSSGAENSGSNPQYEYIDFTPTGFNLDTGATDQTNASGATYVYIAIRRGPMKTPTVGTSVFAPVARTGTSSNATRTAPFSSDTIFVTPRNIGDFELFYDRLRGISSSLPTNDTSAELTTRGSITMGTNSYTLSTGSNINSSSYTYVDWLFRRAPGFFDVVCYTGTGAARTVNHNLGVVPELMIVKSRNNTSGAGWAVYPPMGNSDRYLFLNLDMEARSNAVFWNSTAPTSSLFTVGDSFHVNNSGSTYVAYLFASCPGVSKVGSYTGNGSSQTINCGFSNGARFVMIKRTDSTGDWYVWDTARGIVAANDPHLSLNTTAAEVTTDDTIDPDSTGFIVNQVTATNINVNGATYIYLAIA